MLYRVCQLILQVLYKVIFRFQPVGLHHIPAEGPVILCSNHISNLDPPTIAVFVKRKVHFMAKAELFAIPLFNVLIRKLGAFPVRRGAVSKETIRSALQLLEQGRVLGIFPEGTRSAGNNVGKKGAASLAFKSGAAVVPVTIVGSYTPFKRLKVIYGPPIDMTPFADLPASEALNHATEVIMERIRSQKG